MSYCDICGERYCDRDCCLPVNHDLLEDMPEFMSPQEKCSVAWHTYKEVDTDHPLRKQRVCMFCGALGFTMWYGE